MTEFNAPDFLKATGDSEGYREVEGTRDEREGSMTDLPSDSHEDLSKISELQSLVPLSADSNDLNCVRRVAVWQCGFTSDRF